jgi:hypothetical protein
VNNAVARVAGLLSVALLPLVAGLRGAQEGTPAFAAGVSAALRISAAVCALGGLVAFLSVRRSTPTHPVTQPSMTHACTDLAVRR